MKVFNLVFIVILVGVGAYTITKISNDEPKITYFTQKPENSLGLPELEELKRKPASIEKVALGRKLFMDRRLSHNNTISCAMCHVPEQGFTVNELATAVGIEGRTNRRNAPTIFNVGFYENLFHDGRETSLENQILGPILSFNEMGNPSVGFVLNKISTYQEYQELFDKVYGGPVNLERLLDALASYERSLISGNSKFDKWYYGNNKDLFNESESRGFNLFTGKAKCVSCHSIDKKSALFTDQKFHNTGIGWSRNNEVVNKVYKSKTFPVTLAPGVIIEIEQDHFDETSEQPPNDVGRFEITENPNDSWFYKTPSLRNISITAPYMHNGSLSTLHEVVEFYNKGGEENPYKDKLLTPLNLSKEEKDDLQAFLKTLTGSNVSKLSKEARDSN